MIINVTDLFKNKNLIFRYVHIHYYVHILPNWDAWALISHEYQFGIFLRTPNDLFFCISMKLNINEKINYVHTHTKCEVQDKIIKAPQKRKR